MAALGVPCIERTVTRAGHGARDRHGDDGHSYMAIRGATGTAMMPSSGSVAAPAMPAVTVRHFATTRAWRLGVAWHKRYSGNVLLHCRKIAPIPALHVRY